MQIGPGTRFGAYEITAAIGAGGMGEVYRARDTKLDRDVAIKVLPELFAEDPERLARFEREAKTLASLNHPNIAHVHGVVEGPPEGGRHVTALVMELVDGEDLSQRLTRGAIPVTESLDIARQIADALEAAHERGIVHRDLKPANLKVREDGTVKVLDFGLAKALTAIDQGVSPGDDGSSKGLGYDSNSPTFTSPARLRQGYGEAGTEIGVILGTAAYMAPEQAKGKTVDKRADIWAFGCVLYEMLTGRRAFAGNDVSEMLASVLAREVDWTALPAATPSHVRALLRACLQKDPKQRLRDIGDARLQLDAGPPEGLAPVPPAQSRFAVLLPWAVAAVCVAGAASAVFWSLRPAPSVDVGTVRLVVTSPYAGGAGNPVLSADGSFLVFAGDRLYIRKLSEFTARALPGTENAEWPFVSADGKWVGFFAAGRIRKVAIAGGDPLDIVAADADSPGAAWGMDNRVYFSRGWNDASLVSVPADGGEVTPVSTLDAGNRERGHWWPHPLPDGRHLLFTIWYAASGLSESKVAVLDLQTGKHRVLFPGAMPRYAAGYVLYYRAGGYNLVPFDARSLRATGDPQPVLHDAVGLAPQGTSLAPVSLSSTGTVAYIAGSLYREHEMIWVHRDGRQEPAGVKTLAFGGADLSPDGRRIAVGRPQAGTVHVLVVDLAGQGQQRLTAGGMNWAPRWHPDGQRIAFISMRKGDFDALVQRTDGSPEEVLEAENLDFSPEAWLPDGKRLIAKDWQPDGTTSVVLFDIETKKRTPLVTGPFGKAESRVSPDGRWLAIMANPSGAWHVHLRPISDAGGFQQISSGDLISHAGLRWSPRGDRLFYVRDSTLTAVTLAGLGGALQVGQQEAIAQLPRYTTLVGVSPDGQRVLVAKPLETPSAIPQGIRVIVNGLKTLHRAERPE